MVDTPKSESCPVCGRARQRSTVGTITQWISTCACEDRQTKTESDPPLQVCGNCQKRIATKRQGSMTQWVFQTEYCQCDQSKIRPMEPSQSSGAYRQPAFEGFKDTGEGEEELPLKAEQFPLDRYKPVAKIGEGATGTVYLCRDRLLHKKVAVKVLKHITEEQMVSFQNEARTTAKLEHPAIVQILDFGATASSAPYMVMEYLDGQTLKSIVQEQGPIDPLDVLSLFIEVTDAIGYAHEQGIFHRDLQSSNIVWLNRESENSVIRIVDFGLARIKHASQEPTIVNGNTIVGTPLYMSPDQVNNRPYDARSEIYSIGCILFETLTGAPPFFGESALETINMHATKPPPSLIDFIDVDSTVAILDELIQTCLAKDPADRFQTVQELNGALVDAKENRSVTEEASSERPSADIAIQHELAEQKSYGQSTLKSSLIPIGIVLGVALTVLFSMSKVFNDTSLPSMLPVSESSVGVIPLERQEAADVGYIATNEILENSKVKPIARFSKVKVAPLDSVSDDDAPVYKIANPEWVAGLDVASEMKRKNIHHLIVQRPLELEAMLKDLANAPMISLQIEGFRLTQRDLMYLSQNRTLKALKIDGSDLEYIDIEPLHMMSNLLYLHIVHSPLKQAQRTEIETNMLPIQVRWY